MNNNFGQSLFNDLKIFQYFQNLFNSYFIFTILYVETHNFFLRFSLDKINSYSYKKRKTNVNIDIYPCLFWNMLFSCIL